MFVVEAPSVSGMMTTRPPPGADGVPADDVFLFPVPAFDDDVGS